MEIILIAFISGTLTVLAPCILSFLPVIIGGSAGSNNKLRPILIVGSLCLSVIAFTFILKVSTTFIIIPTYVWSFISGLLVTLYGVSLLSPITWSRIAYKLKLNKSEEQLDKNVNKSDAKSALILGASLGPIFTTCSPTYALILAIVLPANLGLATASLVAFCSGMALPLLLIGYGGQSIANKFKSVANPNGKFKKILAIILIISGLIIMLRIDKKIEEYLISKGFVGLYQFEEQLIENRL